MDPILYTLELGLAPAEPAEETPVAADLAEPVREAA